MCLSLGASVRKIIQLIIRIERTATIPVIAHVQKVRSVERVWTLAETVRVQVQRSCYRSHS